MFAKFCAAIGVCVALSACAVGNTVDYRDVVPPLGVKSAQTVAVEAKDQRPYVLRNDNTPQWVGMVRGGFGNPFGVHTQSDQPLADDLTKAAIASLQADGVKAMPAGTRTDRTLTITVKDWKSDSMYTTSIYFDAVAEVRDGAGNSLAKNAVNDKQVFGNEFQMPASVLQRAHDYFRALMDRLLSQNIRDALG